MFRKSYFSFILLTCALSLGSLTAFGQFAPISGNVEMDGTHAPVAGATVEAWRLDIKQSPQVAKTGKNGSFTFAGLPLGPDFVLAVSGPGITPTAHPGVHAGTDKVVISVTAGDGRKLTEAEVRSVNSNPANGAGEMSAEEKKQRAEIEAKNAEITAKNEKAKKANEVVLASLKAGNEAIAAKNYDLAIAKYEEGIAIDPDYVGSAPQLNINRALALTNRGVETRNKAVTAADPNEKLEGLNRTKKDFADAAKGFMRSWTVLNNATPAEIADKANYDAAKLATLKGARETFRLAIRLEQVDPAVIDAAKVLIPEYMKVETDAAKKSETTIMIADLYRVSGDSTNAIAGYRAVLETDPENLDALAGAGFSLINDGYVKVENGKNANDKAMQDEGKKELQEGSNLLGKFAAAAPDTHRFKADAVTLIDMLKKEQNVAPQKVTTTKKKQ